MCLPRDGQTCGFALDSNALKVRLGQDPSTYQNGTGPGYSQDLHLRCLYLMGVALSQACILEAATSGIQTQEISPVPKPLYLI